MQEKNIITQTKKEFQSMLSTFSHEIRNPLALITSEMQMLSDSQPQLCFNEHWDNIMENLNYIRELLDELSTSPVIFPRSVWIRPKSVRLFLTFSVMRRNLSSILTAEFFFPLLSFRTVSRSPSRITDVA